MGSITQLQSGSWRVRIELPRDERGKRRWWSDTVPTKRQAEKLEHKKEVELAETGTIDGHNDGQKQSPKTIMEAVNKWISYKRGNVAQSTINTYERWADRHISGSLGDKHLDALKPGDLRDFLDHKRKDGKLTGEGGLSWESVKHLYTILNQTLDHAVEDGLLEENPMRRKFLPSRTVEEKQGKKAYLKEFTLEKIQRLKHILTQDYHYGPLFAVALETGMRKCELLGLRWECVELDCQWVDVERAMILTGGEWVEKSSLKTENAARRVELDRQLVEHFERQQELQQRWKLQFEGEWPDHDRVFTTSEGTPPDNLLRRMRQLLDGTGLPRVTFHDLRHLHCTMLIANGAPYNVVQKRVGHSTVKMMLDRYTHTQQGQQRQALSQMREGLEEGPQENGH